MGSAPMIVSYINKPSYVTWMPREMQPHVKNISDNFQTGAFAQGQAERTATAYNKIYRELTILLVDFLRNRK